jgi:cyclophilin family peptidyl-prolyl cis-trans isomerase
MTRTFQLAFMLITSMFIAATASAADTKPAGKNPTVVIKTSMGTIKAEIFADKAPITAENFLKYVDDKHYDGLVFHRVIKGFMIQGGGLDKGLNPKQTRAPIKNEASNGLKNVPGTLSMARTGDPNSATSQFFINTVENKSLDFNDRSAGYAVFGKVIEGMDVVNKIGGVATGTAPNGMGDVPNTPVVIESITRAK